MTSTDWTTRAPAWFASERRMSLGVMIPIGEGSHFGGTPTFDDMVEMTRAAAESGFEVAWFADHFGFAADEGFRGNWEAFTTMAAVAALVPDIQIGVLVACTGFRTPGVLAKMATSIDAISGGRFILGLGAGWHEPEYERFGYPFDHRVSRFEESIEIVAPLLRGETVTADGTYFSAENAVDVPRGPRESGPPILVGSSGDRMLRIIARHADAWNTVWHRDPADVAANMAKLDAACDEVGRPRDSIIRTAGGNFAMDGCLGRRPDPFEGDTDAEAAHLAAFRDLGIVHFVAGLDPCTPQSIRDFAPVIAAFDAQS